MDTLSYLKLLYFCVMVYRHVNSCGSFCVVSLRKGEEIEKIAGEMKERDR